MKAQGWTALIRDAGEASDAYVDQPLDASKDRAGRALPWRRRLTVRLGHSLAIQGPSSGSRPDRTLPTRHSWRSINLPSTTRMCQAILTTWR